ncbi:MAG: polysaccharide deacetylase family protein [Clostridiales bacterium]|nr:polysaccharide deacetylase family protein [Clostridiales bacterium]
MEQIIDHNTHADETEDTVPSTSDTQRGAPPARTIFKPLFFAALALAAVLGGVAAFLYASSVERERDAAMLNAGQDLMRQQLEQAQSDLAAARDELAQRDEELAQARDTIDFLAEYSVAEPDGTVPEYTQLYPDFYAPEWTGETVTGGKVCCLTFDDGPSANTDRVLDTLNRYGIKGTFFIVGSTSTGAASQQRMRDIVAGGHTLAMHSWSHDYKKVYASVEAFLDEFYRLYQWIYEVTGVYPSVYRFPGGSINGYDRGVYQEIIAEMTRRGFVYFDWNASAQDATATPRPAASIAADCLRGIGRDLVVVLTHDSAARGTTVDALPAVIEGYQAAGYTFSALHPGVTPVTMGYPKIR